MEKVLDQDIFASDLCNGYMLLMFCQIVLLKDDDGQHEVYQNAFCMLAAVAGSLMWEQSVQQHNRKATYIRHNVWTINSGPADHRCPYSPRRSLHHRCWLTVTRRRLA